jgi:hypothetical protein
VSYAFERAATGGLVFKAPGVALRPDQTDAFLQVLNNELEAAGAAVRAAREVASEAKKVHKKAETRLLMSPNCPRVGRSSTDVTAAERDAWVQSRCDAEYWALHDAELLLENATDYAWQVKEQVGLLQSLNNNAKAIYDTHRGVGR